MSKLTNDYNLPDLVMDAIRNDGYDVDIKDTSTISVTTMINPPRIRMLTIRHSDEVKQDASEMVWLFLGSACHSMAERAGEKNKHNLVEQRLTLNWGGKTLSGKPDNFDTKTGVLSDWKITSVWSAIYNPEGKKEWVEQLNTYALLLKRAGYKVNELRVILILKDWNKNDAKNKDGYPKIPILVITLKMWTEEEQMKFIMDRMNLHIEAENLHGEELPMCTEEERWRQKGKYAIIKKGNKSATKLCDSEVEANEYWSEKGFNSNDYYIEFRGGKDTRCDDYCQVSKFCSYKNKDNIVDLF